MYIPPKYCGGLSNMVFRTWQLHYPLFVLFSYYVYWILGQWDSLFSLYEKLKLNTLTLVMQTFRYSTTVFSLLSARPVQFVVQKNPDFSPVLEMNLFSVVVSDEKNKSS